MAKIVRGWDGAQIGIVPAKNENPMLIFGYGPDGATCKDCAHFVRLPYRGQTYRKCNLRKITHGKASDHKALWPACKRYEARTEAAHG